MLWGPFTSVEDRLPLLLPDETNKSKKECTTLGTRTDHMQPFFVPFVNIWYKKWPNSEGEEIIAENETNEEEDIGQDQDHTANPTADNIVVPDSDPVTKANNMPQEDNDLENESIVNTSDDEDPMPKKLYISFILCLYVMGTFCKCRGPFTATINWWNQ